MAQPFIGQIQAFGINFAPRGWAQCDGELLPINQNTALFSLLGTMYGGDGRTNFALPDLRSRVPLGSGVTPLGQVYTPGEFGGLETVTLTLQNLPQHNHSFSGSSQDASSVRAVEGGALAKSAIPSGTPNNFYGPPSPGQSLNPASISTEGLGGAHDNIQPYQAINWCIALQGIYPQRQ
jgi:microcystin-dependent protein